jgi:hypothetical protein
MSSPKQKWAGRTKRVEEETNARNQRIGGRAVSTEQILRYQDRAEERRKKRMNGGSGVRMPWDTY